MKIRISILFFLIVSFLIIQIVSAEENEYGIVRAWFNDENATLETIGGVQLKIGEPVEIKVEVISKISGNIFTKLKEPGVTEAFKVLNGPSDINKGSDDLKVNNGWSKTYTWTIAPNGNWKKGNAPINILVQFYNIKTKDSKTIQFTIANPYILDEQYSGVAPTPETTAFPAGTPAKATPLLPVIFTIGALLLVWRLGKRK